MRETIGVGLEIQPVHLPLTRSALRVFELSLREGLQLGHSYIGTEHILLGLIREGEGFGVQLLGLLGVDKTKVRPAVLRKIGEPTSRSEEDFGTALLLVRYLLSGVPEGKVARLLESAKEGSEDPLELARFLEASGRRIRRQQANQSSQK